MAKILLYDNTRQWVRNEGQDNEELIINKYWEGSRVKAVYDVLKSAGYEVILQVPSEEADVDFDGIEAIVAHKSDVMRNQSNLRELVRAEADISVPLVLYTGGSVTYAPSDALILEGFSNLDTEGFPRDMDIMLRYLSRRLQ